MNFISHESGRINGWFLPQDMISFWCIDYCQKQLNIQGDLCEVGVYQGKSFVLLCNLARHGEVVTGYDFFNDGMYDIAKRNITEFAPEVDYILKVGDTSELKEKDLAEVLRRGVRILHIDAGHEYHEVLQQLYLFAPFVSEGGCIIMDDYQDREFPGIEAAVLDFCEIDRPRRFVPFLAGANKMYLCERNVTERYQQNLLQHDVFADKSRVTRVRDFTILVGFSKVPMHRDACLDAFSSYPFLYNEKVDFENLRDSAKRYGESEQVQYRR
jgi:hypothetical protein